MFKIISFMLVTGVFAHPPVGPYTGVKETSLAEVHCFTNGQKIVVTPYFYWYDVTTGTHIRNHDGSDALTTHPPTLRDFTYKSINWHQKQLLDMMDAGIDVLLPVYWGEPSQRIEGLPVDQQPWSFAGIPPLVAAREQLVAMGRNPPRIGLFYDTSTLQWNKAGRRVDLTTDEGRQWFYETIRDFFSLVPAKHWAMVDGRPLVFLYSAGFAAAHDQTCFDYLKESFPRDFGGREPFVVRELSWKVTADSTYAWGGAVGLKPQKVASLGPGYDHSAVPGREPLIVPRDGGAFYERNWARLLRRPTNIVFLETWNEFHEGTDIAESREYGRTYIELTRRYIELFRRGEILPLPLGPYSTSNAVDILMGNTNIERGLVQVNVPDGISRAVMVDGVFCHESVTNKTSGRYLYFRIDDSFKSNENITADIEVGFHDAGTGSFGIEFDGSDTNAPFSGAYTAVPVGITLGGSNVWRTASLQLKGARFLNSQNGGADFRLNVQANPFRVRTVRVLRQPAVSPGRP